MKKFNPSVIIFCLSLLVSLSGCGKKDEKKLLIGSWKIDDLSFSNGTSIKNKKSYEEMLFHFKESSHFSFNDDMTYVGKLEDIEVQSGTWTYNTDIKVIVMKSSQPVSQSILHDTIHVENIDENEMSLSLKEDEGVITAHFKRIE